MPPPPGRGQGFRLVRSPALSVLRLLPGVRGLHGSDDGRVEDLLEVLLRQGRALDVAGGFDLLGERIVPFRRGAGTLTRGRVESLGTSFQKLCVRERERE